MPFVNPGQKLKAAAASGAALDDNRIEARDFDQAWKTAPLKAKAVATAKAAVNDDGYVDAKDFDWEQRTVPVIISEDSAIRNVMELHHFASLNKLPQVRKARLVFPGPDMRLGDVRQPLREYEEVTYCVISFATLFEMEEKETDLKAEFVKIRWGPSHLYPRGFYARKYTRVGKTVILIVLSLQNWTTPYFCH